MHAAAVAAAAEAAAVVDVAVAVAAFRAVAVAVAVAAASHEEGAAAVDAAFREAVGVEVSPGLQAAAVAPHGHPAAVAEATLAHPEEAAVVVAHVPLSFHRAVAVEPIVQVVAVAEAAAGASRVSVRPVVVAAAARADRRSTEERPLCHPWVGSLRNCPQAAVQPDPEQAAIAQAPAPGQEIDLRNFPINPVQAIAREPAVLELDPAKVPLRDSAPAKETLETSSAPQAAQQ
jgi:hypothetical protein